MDFNFSSEKTTEIFFVFSPVSIHHSNNNHKGKSAWCSYFNAQCLSCWSHFSRHITTCLHFRLAFFFSPDLPSHPEWKVEVRRVNIDESSRCRGAFDKCWPCSVMWGMCLITVKQVWVTQLERQKKRIAKRPWQVGLPTTLQSNNIGCPQETS